MLPYSSTILSLFLLSGIFRLVFAEERLVFSYWTDATEPFAFRDAQGHLTGGIIQRIGNELSRRVGMTSQFVAVPVKRLEQGLRSGTLHVDCITNPIWKEAPEQYHWSPVLFRGADRFLVRRGEGYDIQSFGDLKDKHIGVYNGYTYHPEIMKMFASEQAIPEQIAGIANGVKMVKMERLHTLIDFGILLRYQIKINDPKKELALASLHADDYDLQCAYSPKLPVDPAKLDEQIGEMVTSGFIKTLLEQYQ